MKESITHLDALMARLPVLISIRGDILAAYHRIQQAFAAGGKLLVCGNGGSAADAEHIVGELMKGFLCRRCLPATMREQLETRYGEDGKYLADRLQGSLPAISLVSHTALLTAFGNDVSFDLAYAQQVYGFGKPGDVLLGLSTSGNAANVAHAARAASVLGLVTIGMTGQGGGVLGTLCDITIRVPATETPAVQELHLPVYHTLCAMLETAFFS